jgi:anti-sigma B factor antagonist
MIEATTRLIDDLTVVAISGRMNFGDGLASVENLIKQTIDQGARKLVIELSGVNFIDSAAMGILLSCSGRAEQKGGSMRIVGAHGGVAKTFEVVHLDRIAGLDPDLDSARKHFAAGA